MMVWQRFMKFWNELTPNQRMLTGSVGGALVLLVILVGVWAAEPEYSVLYANLEPADAAVIVDRLSGDKIPYKVEAGGRTVRVPQERVHELRLSMAGEGLPSSGTGYELLDSSKLGWTDFVQKLQHRRALEGEIARTITTIDQIQSARVHLVMPEPSLFSEKEKSATASVVLHLRPGGRLSPGETSGIVHLVSSAVEGLHPEDVTLLNSEGTLLSSPRSSPIAGVTNDQLAIVQQVEIELTDKVQSLLDKVLGQGKAAVRIAVDMSFEQTESTFETFDAENPVIRSEDRSESTSPDGTRTETGTTNYEISRRLEKKTAPAGKIQRLTASVFVDGTYTPTEDGEPTYAPRTPEEMTKYENIIKTAIGFDGNRGDLLTVENVVFDTSVQTLEREEFQQSERMRMLLDIGSKVGSLLLVAGIFFFLVRWIRKSTLFFPPEPPRTALEIKEALVPVLPSETELLRERLVEISREQPEGVSRLLRLWLREEAQR